MGRDRRVGGGGWGARRGGPGMRRRKSKQKSHPSDTSFLLRLRTCSPKLQLFGEVVGDGGRVGGRGGGGGGGGYFSMLL